jgi:hypothetical protein
MRKLAAAALALLTGAAALSGCTPARIVAAEGKQVTYGWNARETRIAKVYELAIFYCHAWNAPPALISDRAEGDQHTTTFVCQARPTLPLRRLF